MKEYSYKYMDINGIQMAYIKEGQGEPILLLHGYPQSHLTWRKQIPQLAQKHCVIAPDFIGWGNSEKPIDIDYDFDSELNRLSLFIEQLGLKKFHLFAHDYGGFLGLGYAIKNSDRLLSLAILNSRAHGTFKWHWKIIFWLGGYLDKISFIAKHLPIQTTHTLAFRREFKLGCFDKQMLLERYIKHFSDASWCFKFFRDYEVKVCQWLRPGLSSISAPTAIIWGKDDKYIPVKTAQQLAQEIPNAKLFLIENAGHYIMEERPEEVLQALSQLL